MALTLRSANILMRSPARSRSPPARNPQRWRTLDPSFGLKPRRSTAATERSMTFGSSGGLAGATMPTVSPGPKRSGLRSMGAKVRNPKSRVQSFVAEGEKLSFGLGVGGLEFLEEDGGTLGFSGAAQFFEFLAEFNDAFGAEVKAH